MANPQGTVRVTLDTEDIIAIFAGFIALGFAAAVILGKLQPSTAIYGVIGFTGAGAVIAQIMKARSSRRMTRRSRPRS